MDLDDWYLTSFPSIVRTREPLPHVTAQELQRVMKWKLTKGKWCVVTYFQGGRKYALRTYPLLDSASAGNGVGDRSCLSLYRD